MDAEILYFFFNDTATTEIYTLSLHDALPICSTAIESSNHPLAIFALATGGGAKSIATLAAVDIFVLPLKRRGHRACRNHKRFGFESTKQKCQHKGDHDRFDRLAKGMPAPAVSCLS